MVKPAYLGAAALLAYGAWMMLRDEEASAAITAVLDTDIGDTVVSAAVSVFGLWRAPEQYAGMIARAEAVHGIPQTMLERLLWQESRYRQDIITGATRSPVGAVGIAQFMPATASELGIDPLNVAQSINAAGLYLRRLFARFGNWSEALAAYNWGQGNVARKGLASAPRETVNYYRQILGDVNSATGGSYA